MRLYPSVSAALIAALVAGVVALVLPTGVAHAQLAIDRTAVQLNPAQPDARMGEFVVQNSGVSSLVATVALADWDVDARGASRWSRAGRSVGSCGARVTVSPRAMRLAPGATQVVRVTVAGDARFPRECWSAAVVTPAGDAGRAAASSAVPVYVTPSAATIDGEARDMFVRGDSLEVVFANTGTVRAETVGEVQVRLANDSLVTTLPLPDATVLAGVMRRYRVAMPTLARGSYVLYAVFDFGGAAMSVAQAALEIR
jgi:hypothetical protein